MVPAIIQTDYHREISEVPNLNNLRLYWLSENVFCEGTDFQMILTKISVQFQ